MSNKEFSIRLNTIIKGWLSNEIKLDSLLQWARNPTSMGAGYGIQENYPFIAQNIASRYGMSNIEVENLVADLRSVCDSLIEEAKKLPIESRRQIGEVQTLLINTITQGEPREILHEGMLKRLGETIEETRRTLLTLLLLENAGYKMSPDDLTSPPTQFSDPQSTFQAYFNAIWGSTVPVLRVTSEIVRVGAYNKLFWLPTKNAKSLPRPTLIEGVIPKINEIEAVGTKKPPVPDVFSLLEKLWRDKAFDLLRYIDILSHAYGGFARLDEPAPIGVNMPGYLGLHGDVGALSPVTIAESKQYVEILKSEQMEVARQKVENALLLTKQEMGTEIALGVLWTGMGEVLWKLEPTRSQAIYICLAPWITPSGQSQWLSRIELRDHPHIMLIITHQSRTSLLASLDEYSEISLSDKRFTKSVSFLSDLEQANKIQVLLGERHPVIDRILEKLGHAVAPIEEPKIVSPTPAPEVINAPSVPPPPILSDKEAVFIGNDFKTGEQVTWEPGQGAGVRQPNRNVLIVGKPGTGKSQLIKAFIRELSIIGIPSISLDWVSEYGDVLQNNIDVKKGITMNPLELPSGAGPFQVALETSSIIGAVFSGLGDIQQALLRDAILESYRKKGILEANSDTWGLSPPTFDEVVEIVRLKSVEGSQKAAAAGLYARISPFVVLKLFTGSTTIPFEQLVTKGSSISLKGIPTDELKVVYGHFLLNKLWYYIQNLGGTDLARFYLVLDEANRLAFPGSPLERLVREARKFGVGIIVASQRPGDFTDTVPANAACSIVFQCALEHDAAFMAKQLNCTARDILGLKPTFDALVKFDYAPETRRVKVLPYYQRQGS